MKGPKKLISIIVPVYNTEKYLARCLDSICEQTYTNLEIILVDDGSTDSSGKICDKYAQKDLRIKVIHQGNAGVSAARNVGLELVHGDYIGFVDSDDCISPNMYQYLLHLCIQYKTDLAMCNFYTSKNDLWIENIPLVRNESILRAPCIIESCPLLSMWDKLFSNCLKSFMYFDVSSGYGEDMPVCLNLLEKAGRIAYGPNPQYYYRKHEASATALKNWNPKYLGYFNNISLFLAYAQQHNLKKLLQRMQRSKVTFSVSLLYLCITSKRFDQYSALILQSYIRNDLFFYLFKVHAKMSKKFFALCASINLSLTRWICLVIKKLLHKK